MTSYALLAREEAGKAGYTSAGQRGRPGRPWRTRSGAIRTSTPMTSPSPPTCSPGSSRGPRSPTVTRALQNPKLSGRGRALCALAYFEADQPEEGRKLVEELRRTAKHEGPWSYWTGLQSPESYWWDGGANVEATAWALQAGLRADPKDPGPLPSPTGSSTLASPATGYLPGAPRWRSLRWFPISKA